MTRWPEGLDEKLDEEPDEGLDKSKQGPRAKSKQKHARATTQDFRR
jgi:hypothetical protein